MLEQVGQRRSLTLASFLLPSFSPQVSFGTLPSAKREKCNSIYGESLFGNELSPLKAAHRVQELELFFSSLSSRGVSLSCSQLFPLRTWWKEGGPSQSLPSWHLIGRFRFAWPPLVARGTGNQAAYPGVLLSYQKWSSHSKG